MRWRGRKSTQEAVMRKVGPMNFPPCVQDAITGTEINVEDRDPEEIRQEAKREVNNVLRGLCFRSPERS